MKKELEETIGLSAINYCGGSKGSDARVRAAYYDAARFWYEEAVNAACEWLYDYNTSQAKKFGGRSTMGISDYTISVEDFRKALMGGEE